MKIYVKDKYLLLSFFNEINNNGNINEEIIKKISDGWNCSIGLDGKDGGFGNNRNIVESFLLGKNQNYEELNENAIRTCFLDNYADIIIELIRQGFLEKNNSGFVNDQKGRITLTKEGRFFLNNYVNVIKRFEYILDDYPNITKITLAFITGMLTIILPLFII